MAHAIGTAGKQTRAVGSVTVRKLRFSLAVKLARRTFGCGLVTLLAHRTAFAHTKLVIAVPADGSVLEHAPERIVLRFSSGVERRFSRIALVIASASTDLAIDGAGSGGLVKELAARLPALGAGTHVVRYDVVAADGHRVTGTVRFRVRS